MARWRLKEIGQAQRWSARALAREAELAYNTVWAMWANRSTRADLKTIEALARVLNVKPGELLGEGEQEQH